MGDSQRWQGLLMNVVEKDESIISGIAEPANTWRGGHSQPTGSESYRSFPVMGEAAPGSWTDPGALHLD